MRYHYYNTEEPDGAQSFRDNRESDRLEDFIRSNPGFSRGEPCVDGCEKPCQNCPVGGRCECGNFFPVPEPGWCYQVKTLGLGFRVRF